MNINRVICLVFLSASIGLATTPASVAENRPLNPLEVEIDNSDPVIPLGYQKRKLSVFEINRIKREIEKLDRLAKDKLQQGNGNEAFKLWYRQLKLARAVDPETEIESLGEAGAIAWQANRGEDLRNIANRLITVESEIADSDSSPSLKKLAIAYQQVRYLPQAISVWEQILANNSQKKDFAAVENNLQTLGRLYLSQFDYPSAAKIYDRLLTEAEAESSESPQIDLYLKTLINIYDRTAQKKRAIDTRQRLITRYEAKQHKIPPLQLAIADNYVALDKAVKAIAAYKSAHTLATKNQQLAIAEDALDNLGQLYQQQGQEQKAVATFTRLLKLQRQTYNHYGLINTYDTLGKIYLKSARKQQAKQSFQQALKLAQDLDYKVSYFNSRLEKL